MTDYEAAILDVDGTIVRGDELLPNVADGLSALEDADVSRLLFSNNPTRASGHYGEMLAPYGIDIDPEYVLTSATVSAAYLEETHPEETVYLVGSDRLEGILLDTPIDLTGDPDAADVVVGSFDTDFSFGTLWESLRALADETTSFYGTDPDTTIPIEEGEIPGSGALLAAMEAVAGREPDAILGKPSPIAADAALERLESAPERTLVVGDRLDTDIELGNRAGMTTVLVETGVSGDDDLESATTEPDYVLESLAEIDAVL